MILKTDKRGCVRMPPERREELLAEFDRSGLTLTRFAQRAGVAYSTFATCLQQRRSKEGSATQYYLPGIFPWHFFLLALIVGRDCFSP